MNASPPDPLQSNLMCPQARDVGNIALQVIDNIEAMVAYWDLDQRCRFANEAYRAWFGKSRSELIGTSLQDLLGPLYVLNLPYITEALNGNLQVFERTIPLPDGNFRHSLATYTPDIVGGQVAGFFVHVADITVLKILEQELKAAKEKAEELATHDFLTGLPNRRLITDRFVQALTLAERRKGLMALIVMDMNGFKSVNDTYGHAEGDRLLTITADRMAATIRQSDTLARTGGDEFNLLCVDIESASAVEAIANRLLEVVNKPFMCRAAMIAPTLSIGIAMYPEHGITLDSLTTAADLAMYEAKKRSKNCLAFASAVS